MSNFLKNLSTLLDFTYILQIFFLFGPVVFRRRVIIGCIIYDDSCKQIIFQEKSLISGRTKIKFEGKAISYSTAACYLYYLFTKGQQNASKQSSTT